MTMRRARSPVGRDAPALGSGPRDRFPHLRDGEGGEEALEAHEGRGQRATWPSKGV